MVPVVLFPKVGRRGGLAGILVLAALIRLPQITAPLADNMQIKQVYVSNKARSIARPPLNPFRNTLDFLDERGERLTLTEEVPVYTGLPGLAYPAARRARLGRPGPEPPGHSRRNRGLRRPDPPRVRPTDRPRRRVPAGRRPLLVFYGAP